MVRSIEEIQREFQEDFTIVNNTLLLCKYCDTIVKWRKKTRIMEHLGTKMHQERKEAKMKIWQEFSRDDDDDDEEDEPQKSPQYCLRWNNHQNNLVSMFSRLLGEEQFTDCLLAVDGRKIRAHKLVLSACSSYFESLFSSFDEKNQIIVLKDTSFTDVFYLLEFMYKGEINVPQDQLSSLLKTAENLQIRGLADGTAETTNDEQDRAKATTRPHKRPNSIEGDAARTTPSTTTASPKKDDHIASSSGIEPPRKKRGRPRTLDTPEKFGDVYSKSQQSIMSPFSNSLALSKLVSASNGGIPTMVATSSAVNEVAERLMMDRARSSEASVATGGSAGSFPTPGGPLTEERIKELGVIKLNDYLVNGTRPQFWEEYFVKVIMHAVKNKEIDVKGAAELLGVSYGTLYGRYRELFGYVKHAWNMSGRPTKPATSMNGSYNSLSPYPREPSAAIWTDPNNQQILEQLKNGHINIRQAAEMMGLEPTVLAYQLIGKVPECESPLKIASIFGEEMLHMLMESGVLTVPAVDSGNDESITDEPTEVEDDRGSGTDPLAPATLKKE